MHVVVITPPEPLFSPAELQQLFTSGGGDGGLIDFLARAAQAEIEPPESWVGRSLGKQTLELVLDCFPSGSILLPYGPVRSVISVTYIDAEGASQTVPPAGYADAGERLRPVACWPSSVKGPVRVRYEAGHDVADPQLLPAKHAIALMVQAGRPMMKDDPTVKRVRVDGVDETEWAVSPQVLVMMREAATSILRRYRGVR